MKIVKIVILFLAFVIDVHINAEAVFFPKKCWGVSTPCAVENDSNKTLTLKLKGMDIHLDKHAVVTELADGETDMTRGTLFAKHDGAFRWHTPFGDVLCDSCELIMQRSESSLEIDALKGEVSVVRKGDSGKYRLPPGFRVELSRVGTDGKADLDFPQASALRPLAKTWAKVYSGSSEDFRRDLKDYIKAWNSAVEISSTMEASEANRQIASFEAEKSKDQAAAKARQEEREKLRKLFFEKTFE